MKMDASDVSHNNNGYFWVLCSFVTFVCSNYALGLCVPINAKKTAHNTWKWKNIANSLLHSFISGTWAMICFYQIPEMKEDLINSYSISAQGVISLSVGYFIYDLLDMAIHDPKRSRDLLIHHCLVILCFGLSVCTCYYQGYSLVALLVEVNSIFLHLRQLMIMYGIQKSSTFFIVNGAFNLATFIIFRVFTMGGMIRWLLTNKSKLTTTVFGLGVFSLIVIMGMNFQLLFRVWKSDYRKKSPKKEEGQEKNTNTSTQYQSLPVHSAKVANGVCLVELAKDSVTQNGKTSVLPLNGDSSLTYGKNEKND